MRWYEVLLKYRRNNTHCFLTECQRIQIKVEEVELEKQKIKKSRATLIITDWVQINGRKVFLGSGEWLRILDIEFTLFVKQAVYIV